MNPIATEPVPRMYGTGWLTESWLLFKQNAVIWVLVLLSLFIMQFVIGIILEVVLVVPITVVTTVMHGSAPTTSLPLWMYPMMFVVSIVQVFIQAFFMAGLWKMGIASMRRQPIRFEDVFCGWPVTLPLFYYICAITVPGILVSLPLMYFIGKMGSAGSVSMVVTILVVSLVYSTFYYMLFPGQLLVVDGVPLREAYKRSFQGTLRHFGPLAGVLIIFTLLVMAGLLTCGLAWFALGAMGIITMALVARDVCGIAGDMVTEQPTFEQVLGAWPPSPTAWPSSSEAASTAPPAAPPAPSDDKPTAPGEPDEPPSHQV